MTDIWGLKQERLFAKYRNSPNILGIMEILSDPVQDTRDVLDWLLSGLSIDTAEGELLDFLGEIIGSDRPSAQETDIFWLCGDWETPGDPENRHGLAPDSLDEGGYLTRDDGLPSKSAPGTYMSDVDYRELIRSKAASFRQDATRETVYEFLVDLGVRCKIIEAHRDVEFEPSSYDDLNYWLRGYIEARGFRPAGIRVRIKDQTEPSEEV